MCVPQRLVWLFVVPVVLAGCRRGSEPNVASFERTGGSHQIDAARQRLRDGNLDEAEAAIQKLLIRRPGDSASISLAIELAIRRQEVFKALEFHRGLADADVENRSIGRDIALRCDADWNIRFADRLELIRLGAKSLSQQRQAYLPIR